MKRLDLISARILGTPLAISQRKLDAILAGLGPRLGLAGTPVAAAEDGSRARRREEASSSDGIARIQVVGPLVQRAAVEPASGSLTSYAELSDELDDALDDDDVEGILLELDSPGGEVSGMYDLVAKIEGATKPIFASVNESAYSAAYCLAAACDRIYVARTGGVGSIGVVALHCDQSGSDKAAGLSYTYVHAGAQKVDGNPHAPLSPRAHAQIQSEVDALYDMFVTSVAQNRNLTQKAVRGTEAGTFMGEQAVEAGLADQVGSLDDAVAGLKDETKKQAQKLRDEAKRKAQVDYKARVFALLSLPETCSEDESIAKLQAALSTGKEDAARLVTLNEALVKSIAEVETIKAEHEVEVAKVKAIAEGLAPVPADVVETARALRSAGKADLAKKALDRHLESERAKVKSLANASVQREEGSDLSKDEKVAKAQKRAAEINAAGKKK